MHLTYVSSRLSRVREWVCIVRKHNRMEQWPASQAGTVNEVTGPCMSDAKSLHIYSYQLTDKRECHLCNTELSTTPWRRGGEWRYSSTHSLSSALDGGWSASRPGHFTPMEIGPGAHWIGGWVGPRSVLDAVVKRKIPSPPLRESNPRTPIIQPVAQRYTIVLSRLCSCNTVGHNVIS
jgi:hypothetical protein